MEKNMKSLKCKKWDIKKLKIDSRSISSIIGSLLLISIVTSSMSVLITAISESNRQAMSKESEIKLDHFKLMQEMGEFYDLVKNTNTSSLDNTGIEPSWYWPENGSTDIPLKPECKVYIDGPKSSVATVWFRCYGIDNNYLVESTGPIYKTVDGNSLITFIYDEAVSLKTTYYWKLVVFKPGDITPIEKSLSFTTVSYQN
jgi:hypothetical protein